MWSSIIHMFICFRYKYCALKTHLTYEYIGWCKVCSFISSYFICHHIYFMCHLHDSTHDNPSAKCTNVWLNKLCTISITKLLYVKLVMKSHVGSILIIDIFFQNHTKKTSNLKHPNHERILLLKIHISHDLHKPNVI